MALGRRGSTPNLLLVLFAAAALGVVPAAGQESDASGRPVVKDDWLEVKEAKSKVFLPGEWAYSVSQSPEGTLVMAYGGGGKLQLTLQSIEGKKEITPQKLRDVFEEHIVPGAVHSDEAAEAGLRRRYAVRLEGQDAIIKALFLKNGATAYMVYMQALAEDVNANAEIEKVMDSILGSFEAN